MTWRGRAWRLVAACALAAAAAAVGLAACGSGDDEPASGSTPSTVATVSTTTTRPQAPTPPPAPPDPPAPPVRGPYEPGGLTRIAAQLTAQLGERPRVLEIVLSDVFAHFQVHDPERPGTVNEYEWRDGTFEGPIPVRVHDTRAQLEQELFPLYSINLNAAASLARAARNQPIEGAQPGTMIIRSGLPFRTGVIWYVNVNGTRENRQLRALADGRIYDIL